MRKAREIREQQSRSLMDVARTTTIDPNHLSKFERGVAALSAEKMMELSSLYGVTINELLAPATNGVKEPAA